MIGLIDSGLGGLSLIPQNTSYLYYADTAQFPYGDKSPVELERYASAACAFLLSKGATTIIFACHTLSVHALKLLQPRFPVPLAGVVEPTLQAARTLPKPQKLALLATQNTLDSNVYQEALGDILTLSCPTLVEMIEHDKPVPQDYLQEQLAPCLEQNVTTLILGCTHYGFLEHQIEETLPDALILNPSRTLQLPQEEPGPAALFVTGDLKPVAKSLERLHLQYDSVEKIQLNS